MAVVSTPVTVQTAAGVAARTAPDELPASRTRPNILSPTLPEATSVNVMLWLPVLAGASSMI